MRVHLALLALLALWTPARAGAELRAELVEIPAGLDLGGALAPLLFGWLIGTAEFLRILLSVMLIAPLAFFMGMPFPLGLRRLAEEAPDFVPWAWGINGFASVVSAVLATLLAIHFGFTAVIALALLLYVAAASLRVA